MKTAKADLADFSMQRDELTEEKARVAGDIKSLEEQLACLDKRKASLTAKFERVAAEVVDVERATDKRTRQLRHTTKQVAVAPVVNSRAVVAPCVPMEIDLDSNSEGKNC